MSIVKIKKHDPGYALIKNSVMSDERLSWKAKGILCYLLSKPSDWKVQVTDLAARATDGEYAVRAALNELMEFGYATREAVRGEGGMFERWDYTIYEEPLREYPQVDKPQVGNPDVGNRALNNKDSTNTESTNKESARAAQPKPEPELPPEDLWCERFGIMMTPENIEARNRLRKTGATVEDYESALDWWTSSSGPRTPIYKLTQLEKSIDRARLTRLQSAAPTIDPTKTPGQSRSEKLAEIERQRQERIARKRKEREAYEAAYGRDTGSGNSAGQASGMAPGIATVGD